MSRNIQKFELKPAKTINLKGDFRTLLKEKTLTELESSSQRKSIKRFSSQKIDLNSFGVKKLNIKPKVELPRVKQIPIIRKVTYNKYSPLTTIYAEINRSKKEINSYIKEGKKVCSSLEKEKNKTIIRLNFSPLKTHSKSKTLLTQSTLFESPQMNKTKSILSNNDKVKKIKIEKLNIKNDNKEEEEHLSRRSSISTRAKYKTIEVNKGRFKTYFISYIPKWHLKNHLINIKASKEVIESIDFQKNIFTDEILILLDNLSDYKKKYIINEGLFYYFYNTSLKNQRTINKLLEETIGLLIEICYLLLNEYSKNLDKFIENIQQRPNINEEKYVDNENEEFKINIKKFVDCSNFIKVCFDSYENILLYDKECLLTTKQFYKLMQYLQRARYNTGQLKYLTKSIFMNFNNDDKIVNRFLKEMKIYRNKKKNIDYNIKINDDMEENLDVYNYKPLILKETEEQNKLKRINIALEKDFSQVKRHYHPKHLNFNSKLVNDLLKYATSNFRSQILSERIIQRFKKREREENLNLNVE